MLRGFVFGALCLIWGAQRGGARFRVRWVPGWRRARQRPLGRAPRCRAAGAGGICRGLRENLRELQAALQILKSRALRRGELAFAVFCNILHNLNQSVEVALTTQLI